MGPFFISRARPHSSPSKNEKIKKILNKTQTSTMNTFYAGIVQYVEAQPDDKEIVKAVEMATEAVKGTDTVISVTSSVATPGVVLPSKYVVINTPLSVLRIKELLRKSRLHYMSNTLTTRERFDGEYQGESFENGEDDLQTYMKDVGQVIPTKAEVDTVYLKMYGILAETKAQIRELRKSIRDFSYPINEEDAETNPDMFCTFTGTTGNGVIRKKLRTITADLSQMFEL